MRTFIVKPVDPVYGCAFVVAAEDEEVFGIFDFVCEKKTDGFQRLLASIDVVTEEEVVGFRREATILEQSKEIIVLSMNITLRKPSSPSEPLHKT